MSPALPGILVAVILSSLIALDEGQGTLLVGTPVYITRPIQVYSPVLNHPRQVAAVFSIPLSVPSLLLMPLVRRHVMGGIRPRVSSSGRGKACPVRCSTACARRSAARSWSAGPT